MDDIENYDNDRLGPEPGQLKSAPLTKEQRKQRRLDAQENAEVLACGIDNIFDVRDASVSSLAALTGKSEAHINLLIGVKTTGTKTRGANAFNAWRSSEIARLNNSTSISLTHRCCTHNFTTT